MQNRYFRFCILIEAAEYLGVVWVILVSVVLHYFRCRLPPQNIVPSLTMSCKLNKNLTKYQPLFELARNSYFIISLQ